MTQTNNYISFDRAVSLIERGWRFHQDLKQTVFRVRRTENSLDYFKLNQKTAKAVKEYLTLKRNQTTLL